MFRLLCAGLCPHGDYVTTNNDADYAVRFTIVNKDASNLAVLPVPTGTLRVTFNGARSMAFPANAALVCFWRAQRCSKLC